MSLLRHDDAGDDRYHQHVPFFVQLFTAAFERTARTWRAEELAETGKSALGRRELYPIKLSYVYDSRRPDDRLS